MSNGGADAAGGKQLFKLAKSDLIAELKLSHNVGGISKLRSEQAISRRSQSITRKSAGKADAASVICLGASSNRCGSTRGSIFPCG